MLRKAAMFFGVVLLLAGIAGFIPALKDDENRLLGILLIDNVENVIHILTGALALAASKSALNSKRFFQVFGVVYAIVTVVGFIQGDTVLGIFVVNGADNVLHLLITAVYLYLGFFVPVGEDHHTTAKV